MFVGSRALAGRSGILPCTGHGTRIRSTDDTPLCMVGNAGNDSVEKVYMYAETI